MLTEKENWMKVQIELDDEKESLYSIRNAVNADVLAGFIFELMNNTFRAYMKYNEDLTEEQYLILDKLYNELMEDLEESGIKYVLNG